jgi:hypothetical protein
MKNIQMRGHCQCCGGLWAVVGSTMSKHGYTVEHGWFQGVCPGQRYFPIEMQRVEADRVIADVLQQCEKMEDTALKLEQREIDPIGRYETVYPNGYGRPTEEKLTPYAELTEWAKREVRTCAIYELQSRARMGRGFAKDLGHIADDFHGKPLVEVERAPKTPFLNPGEKRKNGDWILTFRYQQGQRAFYTRTKPDGSTVNNWMGLKAWRALEVVA